MHGAAEVRRHVSAGRPLRSCALWQRSPLYGQRRNGVRGGEFTCFRHSGKRPGRRRIPPDQQGLDGPLRGNPPGSEETLHPQPETLGAETGDTGNPGQHGSRNAGAGVRSAPGRRRRHGGVRAGEDFRGRLRPKAGSGRYPAERNGKTRYPCAEPEV